MKNPLETLSEPRIGCVQHDCDNCKAHRDILVRHLAEIERLRGEVEALKAALSRLDATACADRHIAALSQDTANRLMSEVEALKADAGRYRWLRDQKLDDPEIFIGIDSPDFPNRWALGHEEATKIDAAIDAARSK